jgi:hypothetical protein
MDMHDEPDVDHDAVSAALRQNHINCHREAMEKAVACGDFTQAQADYSAAFFAGSSILKMLVARDLQTLEALAAGQVH